MFSIQRNINGGLYSHGRGFSAEKWAEVLDIYERKLNETGKCTIRELAELAHIGKSSAQKAIQAYNQGDSHSLITGRSIATTPSISTAQRREQTQEYWNDYCNLIRSIHNHKRIVFVGKKIVTDVYSETRSGQKEFNKCTILAAVGLKQPVACQALAFEPGTTIDSYMFFQFLLHLIRNGFLVPGDVLVVDNSPIYTGGDNQFVQEGLLERANILMITLPPYHSELNPTKLVLNHAWQEMKLLAMRYDIRTSQQFVLGLNKILGEVSYEDVETFYQEVGYYRYSR